MEFKWLNQFRKKLSKKYKVWKKINYKVFIKSLYNYTKSLENYTLNIKEEINHFTYKLIRLIYIVIEDLTL